MQPHPAPLPRFVRFKHLQEMGVVNDWPTLIDWIKQRGFPAGFKLSHKVRVWDIDDVRSWVETRRVA
jgi:hypothetical protein